MELADIKTAAELAYPSANRLNNDLAVHGGRKAFKSVMINRVTSTTVKKVYDEYAKFTDEHPDTKGSAVLFELHGTEEFSKVPVSATAFPHRHPFFNGNIFQKWGNEKDDAIVYEWANRVAQIMRVDSNTPESIYSNYGRDDDDNDTTTAVDERDRKAVRVFGENLERLKELKRKYDPNVFFDKGVVVYP